MKNILNKHPDNPTRFNTLVAQSVLELVGMQVLAVN